MTNPTFEKTPPSPADVVASLGLTVESAFVPLSRSRNAESDRPSLNWKVTIKRDGRDVLTTDYGAGIAHAPGYQAARVPASFTPRNYRNAKGKIRTATEREALEQWREYLAREECETGLAMEPLNTWSRARGGQPDLKPKRKRGPDRASRPIHIEPNPLDVIACLVMDSSVLDAGGFEGWAADFGYDSDSIKARGVYDACLETALAMRAGLGDSGMAQLADAFSDY